MKEKVICIDFDGTCVTHEFPHVGQDIGAASVLRALNRQGHKLILYTMRSDRTEVGKGVANGYGFVGPFLKDALDWFSVRKIPLWGVQRNPEQDLWTTSPKCYANLYIDDAALGCPLVHPKEGRPYVDWVKVVQLLKQEGYLK